MRRKDGREIPCELSFFQWGTATQILLGAIVRDITERKKIHAEAVRAAHLASIGELAAGVAHEINNPVNGIINCADILKLQFEKKGEDPDVPLRIMKEGERVAAIVKNLLTFARERKGKMEPQSAAAIYGDAFALMAKQFERNFIAVHARFSDMLPPVLVKPQQIQQVFINLLSNARYALNQKYPDRDPDKRLDIAAQAVSIGEQPFVRIVFYDRGTGVPDGDLAKLCNPFFSTKPPGEGTGLGLSISYKIIQDHGGSMTFESAEGEFMRVTLDLPAAAG
jgi:signal transduction histidine kinase